MDNAACLVSIVEILQVQRDFSSEITIGRDFEVFDALLRRLDGEIIEAFRTKSVFGSDDTAPNLQDWISQVAHHEMARRHLHAGDPLRGGVVDVIRQIPAYEIATSLRFAVQRYHEFLTFGFMGCHEADDAALFFGLLVQSMAAQVQVEAPVEIELLGCDNPRFSKLPQRSRRK